MEELTFIMRHIMQLSKLHEIILNKEMSNIFGSLAFRFYDESKYENKQDYGKVISSKLASEEIIVLKVLSKGKTELTYKCVTSSGLMHGDIVLIPTFDIVTKCSDRTGTSTTKVRVFRRTVNV